MDGAKTRTEPKAHPDRASLGAPKKAKAKSPQRSPRIHSPQAKYSGARKGAGSTSGRSTAIDSTGTGKSERSLGSGTHSGLASGSGTVPGLASLPNTLSDFTSLFSQAVSPSEDVPPITSTSASTNTSTGTPGLPSVKGVLSLFSRAMSGGTSGSGTGLKRRASASASTLPAAGVAPAQGGSWFVRQAQQWLAVVMLLSFLGLAVLINLNNARSVTTRSAG